MGPKYSVCNETAYTWHYRNVTVIEVTASVALTAMDHDWQRFKRMGYRTLAPGATVVFDDGYPIFLRYENHTTTDLTCDYGGYEYKIIERRNRSQFELLCGTKGHEHVCPHFDQQEKSLRQQQRREEQRREQERIEQQRQEEQRREQERIEQQRREQQRREQERRQQQRLEQEQREQQRQEQLRREQEQREQQRIQQLRREQQRREQEQREQQIIEQLRREQEQREVQRIEQLIIEQQRFEQEQREQQRIEQQRREQQRREQQRREQQRREQKRREQQRREQERREQEQREQQRQEQLRREQQRIEQLRREQQRIEQLRREQEQREQQRQEQQERRDQELHELRELQKQKHKEAYYLLKGEDNTADPLDELSVVEQRFDDMLSEFEITEDKDRGIQKLEDRMMFLQNELMIQYFGEDQLPFNSLLAIDQAIGYEDLSLTEKLNVLKAMVKLTVYSDYEDVLPLSQSREHGFLLRLLTYLLKENSDLAVRVLYSFTESVTALTSESKELLGHILFNDVWTPDEIILFLQRHLEIPQNHSKITAILETVLTYRLSCSSVLCALHERDPVKNLSQQVESEVDKDLDMLISEMRETHYPESTLIIMYDVLGHVQDELPKLSDHTRLSKDEIYNGKRMICSLDCANPDTARLQQLLILMSRAVRECTGYFPRLTQLASLLLLLLPKERKGEGCLLEIATGEGKTCILAMFAAIQAIRGVKPDIVTSSPVLADRDQKQWSPLYSMFDLTSSVVPPEMTHDNSEELVRVAYSKDIVYGTVGTFAADTLKQEFEGETTRDTRRFDMVIVDEVDYMTLDNGVQITFLSHQDSVLRHMEQVLAGIWAMLSASQPIEMLDTGEIHWITQPQHFHKTVVSVLGVPESEDFSALDILQLGVKLGLYSQDEISELVQAESKVGDDEENQDFRDAKTRALEKLMGRTGPAEQYNLLRTFEEEVGEGDLVEYFSVVDNKAAVYEEIISSNSSKDKVRLLLLEKGFACQIIPENDLISRTVDRLKSKIKYSDECDPKDIKSYSEFIVIPSFLKEYTEHQLQLFAENALRAIGMVEGREYMIEKAPEADTKGDSDSESHQYDAIIPVDFMSSGVLQKNSKWGDGLQQFLEIKHQLAISPLTTVTNYMSNIHYFQMYLSGEGIFGVSGTLGGGAEKAFLSRHYQTNSYVMPTHHCKKVVELQAIQVQGNKLWIQKICETACKVTNRGQVVLIVCEDVKTANELHTEMQTLEKCQITMYTISGRHEIETQTFSRGNIIIATNLAGRGTDIQVQPEVNKCGGLFVLLTHFPKSQRVEKQVFGRTARKGYPGMVQMILSQEQLEPAYQGQSVEVMRQFREQRELNHIQHMEADELHVIDNKEKLFSTFCGFLDDFRKNYTVREKMSCDGMKIQEVPECLKSHRDKFDYHPAVNSLKESWAFWLTHHEDHICKVKTEKDIGGLIEHLRRELQLRSNSLLKGESKNFHDHTRQAASRTDLHRWNKSECYGSKTYWQSAAVCDPFYSAVALYNKAYVTINLRKEDYVSEAEQLLEKAQDLVDVFLNETTNTMMFCNLSVTNDFKSHHDNSNFLMQMQVRMNLFKSWKDYIKSALRKLTELQKSGDDAITEESPVYCLLKEKDFITANELRTMYKYGLGIVFEVKKKPTFSWDSLICFFIGALQVVAGALVCVLSGGAATNFGLGLISEGVSDMIAGITGMIKGTFDWADWAISKSISIGMSLLCGGFKVLGKGIKGLKNIGTSVRNGAKSIVEGTKSVTIITFKQATKQAVKYTGQELAKQGLLAAVNYGIDEAFKAVFQKIFRSAFEKKVSSLIRANSQLDAALTQLICQEVPQEVIKTKTNDFKIDPLCEEDLRGSVTNMTTTVIPDLLTDLTQVHKVISILSQVCNSALSALEKNKAASGILSSVSTVLGAAEYTTSVIEMLESIPTKEIINGQFVPQLLMKMEHLQQKDYKEDGRQKLSDVKRLKQDLIKEITMKVSDAFVDAFVAHTTSIASRITTKKTNKGIGKCVENVLGRHKTTAFFDDQKIGYKLRVASQAPPKSLSKSNESELSHYAESLSSSEKPATGLDLHILTKSNLLKGKGVRIILTDEHGGPLYEEYYPGSQSSSGDITLRLVKEKDTSQQKKGVLPSLSRQIRGELTPYSGHFEVVNPDGTISPVHSEGQNCFYHAIAQATSRGPREVGDLRREASTLRNELKQEVQQNLPKYGSLLRLQQGYENSYRNPGRFTISGGTKKNRKEDKEKYENAMNKSNLPEKDRADFKALNLGLVGEYRDVTHVQKESSKEQRAQPKDESLSPRGSGKTQNKLNADHIPPTHSYSIAQTILAANPADLKDLKKVNKKGFESLEGHRKLEEECKNSSYKKSKYRGDTSWCMEVRAEHHKQALTTGNSMEARVCREEIGRAVSKGDVETTLKMSFITAHPETSQHLRNDAGVSRQTSGNTQTSGNVHSTEYYHVGYKLLIDRHCDKGLIDSNVKERLHSWVNDKEYKSKNTEEYKSLSTTISGKIAEHATLSNTSARKAKVDSMPSKRSKNVAQSAEKKVKLPPETGSSRGRDGARTQEGERRL